MRRIFAETGDMMILINTRLVTMIQLLFDLWEPRVLITDSHQLP